MATTFLKIFLTLTFLTFFPRYGCADPVSLPFKDCSDAGTNESSKFHVDAVYGQVLRNEQWGHYLNLTVFGSSSTEILGQSNSSLSTLFTTTSVLTLDAWRNNSFLCDNVRPPSSLLSANRSNYCPIPAGPFALSSTVPWGSNRELTTLITRVRAVDPFTTELLCLEMVTTPLSPEPGSPYGKADIIFWSTISLAIGYWILIGVTRIATARKPIARSLGLGIWSRVHSAGYILASAISGQRFATSPALLRFCTPSMRDVIFHTQWCATLAMVAVEWPQFVYPLLTQTAWATLVYNTTLTHRIDAHWDPLYSSFSPPSEFADQVTDPNSPIYIDRSVPNVIFSLPPDAKPGISSFAYALGMHPRHLFPTCIILFLGLVAGTVVLSSLICLLDYAITSFLTSSGGQNHNTANTNRLSRVRSFTTTRDLENPSAAPEEIRSLTGSAGPGRARLSFPLVGSGSSSLDRGMSAQRAWWKPRLDIGAFHGSVLHGNLVRLLILFHLPVTVFSCYQMTLPPAAVGATSIVLAALSFTVFSILIPLHLVIRVTFTKTKKLYDQTQTLLSLGPLYNHYRHESQLFAVLSFATNIALGVAIGVGQRSGTAQSIVILVIEVGSALVTSIWLPWGPGASMGLISFLLCVARLVIAVLMVILSQVLSIGIGPGSWVAYGILIILALVYFALIAMLLVKVLEGLLRLFGGIGFNKCKHTIDSGILGVFNVLGCCGRGQRRHRPSTRRRQTTQNLPPPIQRHDSDLSSYLPPPGGIHPDGTRTPPRFLTSESRKGSLYSHPPSVLKPEHANRPYREDSDDEGHIMGAFQRFPSSAGHASSTDGHHPPSSLGHQKPILPSTPGSGGTPGFSRVGGGRAHIDSPYAITTESTHAFPSVAPRVSIGSSHGPVLPSPLSPIHGHGFVENLSVANVESGLPLSTHGLTPETMHPAHVRTKSQSAIIEDYPSASPSNKPAQGHVLTTSSSSRIGLMAPKYLSQPFLQPSATAPPTKSKFTVGDDNDDDSGEEAVDHPKKKKWYHLRKNRPHSSDGPSSTSSKGDLTRSGSSSKVPLDQELRGGLGSGGSQPSTQRSFVVIRKPQGSMGRISQHGVSSSLSGSPAEYPKASSRPPTR